MRVLVQTAMRLRLDRLIIGEVRGAEALEMLKSWATGHGSSACTIHAGSPERALRRLRAAVQESGVPGDPELIGEVVDLIVLMKRRGSSQWGVEEIVACDGWAQGRYRLTRLDTPREEAAYGNGASVELKRPRINLSHEESYEEDACSRKVRTAAATGHCHAVGGARDNCRRSAALESAVDHRQRCALGDASARHYDRWDCVCRSRMGLTEGPGLSNGTQEHRANSANATAPQPRQRRANRRAAGSPANV
jgi:hypothetical protein